MIKLELVKNITKKFNVDEINAANFVDNIFDTMFSAFKKGKNINIPEFGKFSIVKKSVNGIRQKYVTFSPFKNFADEINENFTDLEPCITKVYSLKNNSVLKLKEILPQDNEDDYLYFVFEGSEESASFDDISAVENVIPEQKPEAKEEVVISEQKPEAKEDINTKEQTVFQVDNLDEINIFNNKKEQNIFPGKNIKLDSEITKINDETVIQNDIYTESELEDIPFDEKKIVLSDITQDSEQIIDDDKSRIIEHIEIPPIISPLVFSRKDAFDYENEEDNLERDILNLLIKREEILREMNLFDNLPGTMDGEDVIDEIKEAKKEEVTKSADISENISNIIEKDETVEEREIIPENQEIVEKDDQEVFAELEKRINELSELTRKQDELISTGVHKPQNSELKIFDKLIDDQPVIEELAPIEPENIQIPEVIVEEIQEEDNEPKSMSDAFENVNMDGIFEHIKVEENPDDAKSFSDVFKNKDSQFVPQFTIEDEQPKTQGRFFKIFLYVFFIFLVSAFSFYIYKSIFNGSGSNQVIDTIGLAKIDSVRQLLAKSKSDSISKSDNSKSKSKDEIVGESVEIKTINDIVYRELGNMIYIQNKVVDNIDEANEIEVKLKLNNLSCRVEAVMTVQNKLEYRVLVGPFDTMEEAGAYYELNKAVLNFIQILNPKKSNLLVL